VIVRALNAGQIKRGAAVRFGGGCYDAGAVPKVTHQFGRQEKGREMVDVKGLLNARPNEATLTEQPPGVVDEQVEAAGPLAGGIGQVPNGIGIGEVCLHEDGLRTGLRQGVDDRFSLPGVPPVHDHIGAEAPEGKGNGTADAAG
jgi:hypothetical protein